MITSILKTTSLSKQTSFRGATVSLTVVSQWGEKVKVAPQISVSCFHKHQYEKISKQLCNREFRLLIYDINVYEFYILSYFHV